MKNYSWHLTYNAIYSGNLILKLNVPIQTFLLYSIVFSMQSEDETAFPEINVVEKIIFLAAF